jgi:FkbM family methyltransferase
VRGLSISLSVTSETEHFRADTYATKEPETLDWLDTELRPHDVLWDIGANIGLYSLYAAKRCPEARIYAFEPESLNFSQLQRNLALNRCVNVLPHRLCIADHVRLGLLHVSKREAGASLYSFGRPEPWSEAGGGSQECQAVSIDALVVEENWPCPTLLKIDVDGLEQEILDGAWKTLQSGRIRSILIEVDAPKGEALTWAEHWLAPFGYRLARTSTWVYEANGRYANNQIFNLFEHPRLVQDHLPRGTSHAPA